MYFWCIVDVLLMYCFSSTVWCWCIVDVLLMYCWCIVFLAFYDVDVLLMYCVSSTVWCWCIVDVLFMYCWCIVVPALYDVPFQLNPKHQDNSTTLKNHVWVSFPKNTYSCNILQNHSFSNTLCNTCK